MSLLNSLFPCFGKNNVDRTASLQPVEQQPDVEVSSLKKLFTSAESQCISNTASILNSKKCCIIETALNYYTARIENSSISVTSASKPSSGLWMSIKQIIYSLFTDKQFRENKLQHKLAEEIQLQKQFIQTQNHTVTDARAQQLVMSGKYWRIVNNAQIHDSRAMGNKKAEEKAKIAFSLMATLKKLPDSIIDSMETAANKECLDELDRVRHYLNKQQRSVSQLFVNGDIDAALGVWMYSVDRCGVILEKTPHVPQILDSLCEQFINAGASPVMALQSLSDVKVANHLRQRAISAGLSAYSDFSPTFSSSRIGGASNHSWLVAIIRHTRPEHRAAVVKALAGNAPLENKFIMELKKHSGQQQTLETWEKEYVSTRGK